LAKLSVPLPRRTQTGSGTAAANARSAPTQLLALRVLEQAEEAIARERRRSQHQRAEQGVVVDLHAGVHGVSSS
jgi:hypothetical protein